MEATVSITKNHLKWGRIMGASSRLRFLACREGLIALRLIKASLRPLRELLIRFIPVECLLIVRMSELCWWVTMEAQPREIPINLKQIS